MEICGRLRGALCFSMVLPWISTGAGTEPTPALKLRVAYKNGEYLVQKELHCTYTEIQWFYSCLCQRRSWTWSVPLAAVNESTLKIASTTEECMVDNSGAPSRTGIYQCNLFAPYHKGNPALTCTERVLDPGLCPDRPNVQPEAQCLSLTMGNSNICHGLCIDFLWDPSQRVRSVETTNSQMHLGSCRSVKSTATWTSISTSTKDKDNTTEVGGSNKETADAGVIAGIVAGVVVLIIITVVVVVALWRWRKHKLLTLNSVPSNLQSANSSVAVHQRVSSLHSESEIAMSGTSQARIHENKDDDGYMLMDIGSKTKSFPNAPHIKDNSRTKERHFVTQDKDHCAMSYEAISKDFDGTDDVNHPTTTEYKRTHNEGPSGGKPAVRSAERKPHCSNHNDQSMDAVYAVICKKSKPILSTSVLDMENRAYEPSSENTVFSSPEETIPTSHENDHQSETASNDVYATMCKEIKPKATMLKPSRARTHNMLSNPNACSSLGKSQNFYENVVSSDTTSGTLYSNVY